MNKKINSFLTPFLLFLARSSWLLSQAKKYFVRKISTKSEKKRLKHNLSVSKFWGCRVLIRVRPGFIQLRIGTIHNLISW